MLTHEETMRLIRRAQAGDAAANTELINANMALVRSVVKRYVERGVEYEDLFQLGCIGLIKAIRNFDVSFAVRFSTYAVPMIAGEIKRFLRDDGPLKVGRTYKELAGRALAVRDQLHAEGGRPPGIEEIAQALGVSREEVAMSLEAVRPVTSLNEPLHEDADGETRFDALPAPVKDDAWTDRILLKELIGELKPRDRTIIVLRYFSDCTQTQVAQKLGISQVQVSRLESRILRQLRQRLLPAE